MSSFYAKVLVLFISLVSPARFCLAAFALLNNLRLLVVMCFVCLLDRGHDITARLTLIPTFNRSGYSGYPSGTAPGTRMSRTTRHSGRILNNDGDMILLCRAALAQAAVRLARATHGAGARSVFVSTRVLLLLLLLLAWLGLGGLVAATCWRDCLPGTLTCSALDLVTF